MLPAADVRLSRRRKSRLIRTGSGTHGVRPPLAISEHGIMSEGTVASRWNLDAIEDAHRRWKQDPASVDESWRYFFEGFELGAIRPPTGGVDGARLQTGVIRLIYAYRDLGHFLAHLDPLSEPRPSHPLLELSEFGLSEADLDRVFDTSPFIGLPRATPARPAQGPARDLLPHHRRRVHAHPGHAHPPLASGAHGAAPQSAATSTTPRRCASSRTSTTPSCSSTSSRPATPARSASRWKAPRRSIPMLEAIVEKAPDHRIREIILGMAHRGRLNVLANILRKPYEDDFRPVRGEFPARVDGRRRRREVSPRLLQRPRQLARPASPPVAGPQPQPSGGRRSGRRGPHPRQADGVRRSTSARRAFRC